MRVYFLFILSIVMYTNTLAQHRTDNYLRELLFTNPDTLFHKVLEAPDTYRLQIIYTQIDRDKKNKPSFTHFFFNLDPQLYFNPASTVKLPLALLSLEKLNELEIPGVDKYTRVEFHQSQPWQTALKTDSTARDAKPTIAHLIKRALLISENDPYNRLYQFVGQETINKKLTAKGYPNSRITRQFLGLTPEQNAQTNALSFYGQDNKLLYHQPAAVNRVPFDFSRKILLGKGHINREDQLVMTPFDFTMHNALPLFDLHEMLRSVIFPQSFSKSRRFHLTTDDLLFIRRYLSQYPSETPDPNYDSSQYFDSYVKFFFLGKERRMPGNIRVFNKVGWSYGFMTDVSYVADFANKIEFMLSATIYLNSDGILNDNKYEYESIGYPFFYQLGQMIYQHELTRPRKHKPNLSELQIDYETKSALQNKDGLKNLDN